MKGKRLARRYRLRVNWRVTVVLAFVVVLALAGAFFISAWRRQDRQPGIQVLQEKHLVAILDARALSRLEPLEIDYGGGKYTAVSLKALLNHLHALPTVYENARLTAGAGSLSFSGEFFVNEDTSAYIAYEQEGKAVTASDGGPFMLFYTAQGEDAEVLVGLRSIEIDLLE